MARPPEAQQACSLWEEFLAAAEQGNNPAMQESWERCGRPAVDTITDQATAQTAWHLGAQGGHLEVLKWMQLHNGKANIRDKDGCTAAHFAAAGGHLKILEWLKVNNHDLGLLDYHNLKPTNYSAMVGLEDVTEWISSWDTSSNPIHSPLFSKAFITPAIWERVHSVLSDPSALSRFDSPPWFTVPNDRSLVTLSSSEISFSGRMLYLNGDYQLQCHPFNNNPVQYASDEDVVMFCCTDIYKSLTAQYFHRTDSDLKLIRLIPLETYTFKTQPGQQAPRSADDLVGLSSCPAAFRTVFGSVSMGRLVTATTQVKKLLSELNKSQQFYAIVKMFRRATIRIQCFIRRIQAVVKRQILMVIKEWNEWQADSVATLNEEIAFGTKLNDPTMVEIAILQLEKIQSSKSFKAGVLRDVLVHRRKEFRTDIREKKLKNPVYDTTLHFREILHSSVQEFNGVEKVLRNRRNGFLPTIDNEGFTSPRRRDRVGSFFSGCDRIDTYSSRVQKGLRDKKDQQYASNFLNWRRGGRKPDTSLRDLTGMILAGNWAPQRNSISNFATDWSSDTDSSVGTLSGPSSPVSLCPSAPSSFRASFRRISISPTTVVIGSESGLKPEQPLPQSPRTPMRAKISKMRKLGGIGRLLKQKKK